MDKIEFESKAALYEANGPVVTIRLNRPEKRNALNDELVATLKRHVVEAASDNECKAIVIRGTGPDFCSGADLSSLKKIADSSIYENLQDARQLVELFELFRGVDVPVLAAVHGRALAGGCGLASACDIVLASESARFGYPEVKIGFVPAIVMAILRRNVSEKKAFELVVGGAEFSAQEAAELGLVNRVFSDASFESDVESYVSAIIKSSRTAVALSKRLLYQMDGMTFSTAMETGAGINAIARMTDDCKKGIARFLDKNAVEKPRD
jgi:methylglutaconyl-CoA hydratase